jgi:UDP-N-acetylmuramoyl-tripeptide--D-alanyl-D-alanine ligase
VRRLSALWTADSIAAATGGKASASFAVQGVAFDSRELRPFDLFVALKGEMTDGHHFVEQALASGAAGALVSTPIAGPHVLVNDTTDALVALAKAARKRMAGPVIGVTGSAGKTSVKEALFLAFDRMSMGSAHRSLKSYNNHVGVPLSLTRMSARTQYGVFEMGMNHAGELSLLTRLVKPDVAIVTTIGPAHIEHLGSEEAIADAKGEIFEGLGPQGVAIIPFDSPHITRLYNKAACHAASVLTFGLGAGADVRAVEQTPSPSGGTMISAVLPDARLSFTVSAPGQHWVLNALAVLAGVHAAGGDLAQAGLALAELPGLPGRGARYTIKTDDGGEALLIDESYNANAASITATLAVLRQEPTTRRIAVLGAMKELGEHSDALHAGLAGPVRDARLDVAVLVGAEMTPLADALRGTRVALHHVPDAAAAAALLPDLLRDGDAVMIKGSNSVGLGALVRQLRGEVG